MATKTTKPANPVQPSKLKVVPNPGEQLPIEILAQSIIDISDGMKQLLSGRLSSRALYVLLHDATGVSVANIRAVLEGIRDLKATYTR